MDNLLRRRFSVYAFFFLLLLWIGCGGGTGSNSTAGGTSGTGTTPTPGTSNPGNTGGSGSGTTGGGSSSSATFLYAGTGVDAGGIHSFQVNTSSGALTEVSGSPTSLPSGFTTGGSLIASKGFVYTVNRASEAGPAVMYTFKADSSTGVLSPVGSPVTVTPQNDPDIRIMKLSPDGNTAYLVSQFAVNAVALNNGSPTLLGTQQLVNGEVWGFALAGNFAYAGIQEGNPKTGFAQPVITVMNINSNGSVGTPQPAITLADSNIPYDLTADASGKFIAATTGFNNNFVTVWTVNSSTGALTAVPGAPFSNGGDIGKKLRFDSSASHLYLINNPDFEPRHEDVMTFNVDSTGALTLVQTLDLGTEELVLDFKVEDDFAYLTNQVSGIQSNIIVLRRDSTSGQLSVVNKTAVNSFLGGVDTLHF
jgi:6-phosphogluconolactonase (cycloisomerase 2 family)